MKKNILAIAIASVVATPVAFADAPTVYGQINMAVDSYDVKNVANKTKGADVVHRNSRLGVKGSEDLGNGLKAVFQAEATLGNGAEAAANNLNFNRNTFAGIAGGFGTVVMGRHDTPLRMIQPNDGFADSKFAGNNTSNFNGGLAGEDRVTEVIAYLSPSFNGVAFALAVSGQDTLAENGKDQALTNAYSGSVSYGSKSKGIYAAAGMTSTGKSGASVERGDITRAVVQYNEAGLVGSFMYNEQAKTNTNGNAAGSSMTLGVAYKMGAITPRAKASSVSYKAGSDKSATNYAVGVDYSLGKNTKVYAEYAALDKNNRAGTINTTTVASLADSTVMSVGLFHKF